MLNRGNYILIFELENAAGRLGSLETKFDRPRMARKSRRRESDLIPLSFNDQAAVIFYFFFHAPTMAPIKTIPKSQ